jgi:hypothetical protein
MCATPQMFHGSHLIFHRPIHYRVFHERPPPSTSHGSCSFPAPHCPIADATGLARPFCPFPDGQLQDQAFTSNIHLMSHITHHTRDHALLARLWHIPMRSRVFLHYVDGQPPDPSPMHSFTYDLSFPFVTPGRNFRAFYPFTFSTHRRWANGVCLRLDLVTQRANPSEIFECGNPTSMASTHARQAHIGQVPAR